MGIQSASFRSSGGITRDEFLTHFLRRTGLGAVVTISKTGIGEFFSDDLRDESAPVDSWKGGWARLQTAAGEVRPIVASDPAFGQIQHKPFSAAPSQGTKVELWRWHDPNEILDELSHIIKHEAYIPTLAAVSDLPNYDFERSASDMTPWATLAGSPSLIDVTEGEGNWVINGRVSMKTPDGAAVGQEIYFPTPAQIYISAVANVAGGTGELRVTADFSDPNATISSVTTAGKGRQRLSWTGSIASTPITIALSSSGGDVYWDDVVMFLVGGQSVALPEWVRDADQVKGIYQVRAFALSGNRETPELTGVPANEYDIQFSAYGEEPLRLVRRGGGGIVVPLYIIAVRPFVSWAYNERLRVPTELITAKLAVRAFEMLAERPTSIFDQGNWAASKLQYWRAEATREELRHALRLRELNRAAPIERLYYDSFTSSGWHDVSTGYIY